MSDCADEMSAGRDEVRDALVDRAAFFRALAGYYFRPMTQEDIDGVDVAALLDAGAQGDDELAAGFDDMGRYLRKRNTGTREQLATDFTSAFGGAVTCHDRVAVPYASVFADEDGRLSTSQRGEVYKAYKAHAFKVSADASMPEDHLSFLLSFAALLSDEAVEALDSGDAARAASLIEESGDFARKHILSWYDSFAELANEIVTTRFYRGLLRATKGYLLLDATVVANMLEALGAETVCE